MTAIDYAAVFQPRPPAFRRLTGALRYSVVLAVWLGVFIVRPALALDILRNRRADSPLPRLRRGT